PYVPYRPQTSARAKAWPGLRARWLAVLPISSGLDCSAAGPSQSEKDQERQQQPDTCVCSALLYDSRIVGCSPRGRGTDLRVTKHLLCINRIPRQLHNIEIQEVDED